jgi:hypothetical protein
VHQVMPPQTLSSSVCWPEDKGRGKNRGGETRAASAPAAGWTGGPRAARTAASSRTRLRRKRR